MTEIFNFLMLIEVAFLTLVPLVTIFGTVMIGRIYFSDNEVPRNRILQRMFTTGVVISIAGLFVSILGIQYMLNFSNGTIVDASILSALFVLSLIAVRLQPFLDWRAFSALSHTKVSEIKQVPDKKNGVDKP